MSGPAPNNPQKLLRSYLLSWEGINNLVDGRCYIQRQPWDASHTIQPPALILSKIGNPEDELLGKYVRSRHEIYSFGKDAATATELDLWVHAAIRDLGCRTVDGVTVRGGISESEADQPFTDIWAKRRTVVIEYDFGMG